MLGSEIDASEETGNLSRKEQKAPAREEEEPTTGEAIPSAPEPSYEGAGEEEGEAEAEPEVEESLGEVAHAPAPVTADSEAPGPAPEQEPPASGGTPTGKGMFSRFTEGISGKRGEK